MTPLFSRRDRKTDRGDWKDDLKNFFEEGKVDRGRKGEGEELRSQTKKFYSAQVKPAFKKLKKELERYGREVNIAVSDNYAAIEVKYSGRLEMNYQVKVRQGFPYPEMHYQDASGNGIWAEGSFKEGIQKYDVSNLTTEQIIENFLREYKSRLWVLYKMR
jgi:hypothetical protein